jgi:hypothetical protein
MRISAKAASADDVTAPRAARTRKPAAAKQSPQARATAKWEAAQAALAAAETPVQVITVTAADLAELNPELEPEFSEPAIGSTQPEAPVAAYTPNPAIAAALTAEVGTGITPEPVAPKPAVKIEPAAPAKPVKLTATTARLEAAAEAARLEFLAEKITRGRYYQAVKALRGAYRDNLSGKILSDRMEALRVISEAAYAEVLARGNAPTRKASTKPATASTKQADPAAKLTAKLAAAEATTAKLKADLEALAAQAEAV